MPESGEWFSPRTRPEMLTSDDPVIHDRYDPPHEHVEILPGPATLLDRVVGPFRRAVAFVPEIGRRIIRIDDVPSRWQLAGMWATGSAIVAATGLAVAAVLGGAPPALTQQFDRLSVLPGLNEHSSGSSGSSAAPAAAAAAAPGSSSRPESSGGGRDRLSASGTTDYRGYSGIPGVPAGASFPDSVVVPGLSSGSGTVPVPGGGGSTPPKPAGGGTSTAPVGPAAPTPAPTPTTPVEHPTEPTAPTGNPTAGPTTPAENPTEPTTPADPTPTSDPPPDQPTGAPAGPPAESPSAEAPADGPTGADPSPGPGSATPAPTATP